MIEATETQPIQIAFFEFMKCINNLGIDKTTTALKNFQKNGIINPHNLDNDVVVFVVNSICTEFNITLEEFYFSKGWSKKRICAIGIATHLFYDYFDFSAKEISTIIKKDKSTCWHNMKVVDELSQKNKEESVILNSYAILKDKVNQFIKNKENAQD